MASIVKRKNRYSVVYTYKDDDGNQHQKWETFDTNADAKKRKTQIEFEQQSGTFIIPNATTVADLLEEYCSVYGVNNWAMSTYRSKKGLMYNYIIPLIGDPKDKFGTECFIWGVENRDHNSWESKFCFGISNVVNNIGDYVQFMDFPINGEMVHHYYFNRQNVTNVFLDIAKGSTEHFSDNDKALAADMVRKGYVISNDKGLFVNAPVFTKEQHNALKNIFSDTAAQIADDAEKLMEKVTKILKNHIPAHLKKFAKDMAYLRLFEDAISASVAILYDRKYLLPYNGNGILPTTYVVLK